MSEFEDAYDDDALAAEYVLHLLSSDDRQAFKARLAEDRDLQARVRVWEARLAPLADDIRDVVPPPAAKARLLKAIADPVATKKPAAVRAWLLGGLIAAGLLVAVVFGNLFGPSAEFTPTLITELATEGRGIVMVVNFDESAAQITVERSTGAPDAGTVHELWVIPAGADTPVSLGVLENSGTSRVAVPAELAQNIPAGTLAVSVEPPGGSPSGSPTGPVIAVATFEDV